MFSRLPVRPTAAAAAAVAALPLVLVSTRPTLAQAPPPAAPAAPTPPTAPAISVAVDGQPIVFTGQGPVLHTSGSVLVPLRGVFEKLGAGVQYAAETKTITAVKGETTIILRLGDPNAFVNGMPHPLSVAPLMLNDSTLVPLRFVSEALGAQVKWDEPAQTVQITTPKPPDSGPVVGVVVGVDAGARTVAIRPVGADKETIVALIPDATIFTKAGDAPAVAADLGSIRIGDQVIVKRNDAGMGFSLESDYEEHRGVVKSVDAMPASGNPKITFADDVVNEVLTGAPVVRGTDAAALGDIQPGQRVILRVSPQTRLTTFITVEIPRVEITSISQSAGTRLLKDGDEVTVTLVGTPGARGVFTVPGIVALNEQPLTESTQTPGTYTGTFKVPNGITIQNGTVTGVLSFGGVTSSPAQSMPGLNIDSLGPVFSDLVPTKDTNTTDQRIKVGGTYKDQDLGSGIDPTGTRLFVNGKDVSAHATLEKGFFLYQPAADLPPGENTATIVARDMAGNETRQEWAFTITPMVNPLRVVTLVDVPEDHPLGAGETLKVRAEAKPGGAARFVIGKKGEIAGTMVEQSPGIYVGEYMVKKGDSMTREPVAVFFRPSGDDKEATLSAIQTVSIRAGAPRPPVIDLPVEGGAVGGFVTISGRGTPNTKVRLDITYNGKVFLFNTSSGGGVANLLIPVNPDGTWKSDVILLNTSRELDRVTFTAEAVTVAKDGDTSDKAVVHFKK